MVVMVFKPITSNAKGGIIEPVNDLAVLRNSILVPEVDFEELLSDYGWSWHQLARREFPEGIKSLIELQLIVLGRDAVMWSQFFLREPDDPQHQDPYNFFEYQKESLLYDGPHDVVHEDASEVGKTREIVPFVLHKGFTVLGGSGLVGAPMQVYLDEIISACEEQESWSPVIQKGMLRPDKKTHYKMRFANGFKMDFRPSSHDGGPYRGVHARTFAIKDEAVKDKNVKTWSEFWRAVKPGCHVRIYSVPDGDRSCEFYKLCQRAKGVEVELDKVVENRKFRRFHWPKSLMPAPFWTPERRRWFEDQYGGEDSPAYRHNVMGEWGDPENSVFPAAMFMKTVKPIAEYRFLRLTVDEKEDQVRIFGVQYGSEHDPSAEVILHDYRESASEFFGIDKETGVSPFRVFLRGFFSYPKGLCFGGADFGFAQDPTEISVKLLLGKNHRRVARLQLRHVKYDVQAEALDAIDDVFDAGNLNMPWGMDLGNAGSAVLHNLIGLAQYERKRYQDRITGVMFGGTYESVDEEGNLIIDSKTEKPFKLTAKELATDLMVKKYQRGEMEEPYDPEILLYYPNHTVQQGSSHRIYKKEDDHIIDADRTGILALVLPRAGGDDLFSCGANIRKI
jgi:hypothetical protein